MVENQGVQMVEVTAEKIGSIIDQFDDLMKAGNVDGAAAIAFTLTTLEIFISGLNENQRPTDETAEQGAE